MSEPTPLSLPVRVQRTGGIAVVTIDNPPVNALSQAVRSELLRVFRALVDESDVRGIVLIGAGRDFVAGGWRTRWGDRVRGEPADGAEGGLRAGQADARGLAREPQSAVVTTRTAAALPRGCQTGSKPAD